MNASRIEELTEIRTPHYEPFGWHHWPEYPWMSYQFRRALGETQEGGGTISECFRAASRMLPGDHESWFREWEALADRSKARGDAAKSEGNVQTAKSCWLRAANYYRSAEFWLGPGDPRRLATFERCEESFRLAARYFDPPGEPHEIPFEGASLYAHFLRPRGGSPPYPVLIALGGLDSFKEELFFMIARGVLSRGIACLLVDGPGQGGTLRRHGIVTRHDYEVPVGRCIDYLQSRPDIDPERIALSGSSLGGYYSARAASVDHRIAAAISHNAIFNLATHWADRGEDHGLASHIKWVFGVDSMSAALERTAAFNLEGVLSQMRCPYLIIHGAHDGLGVRQARLVYDHAKAAGVDVTLRPVTEEETGAEHCQHDNPTLGMELMGDWLAHRFQVDQDRL